MSDSEEPKFPDGWGRMPEGMIGSVEQAIADAAEAKGYKAGLRKAAEMAVERTGQAERAATRLG